MIGLSDIEQLSYLSEQFLQLFEKDIDYLKITDDLLKISGVN